MWCFCKNVMGSDKIFAIPLPIALIFLQNVLWSHFFIFKTNAYSIGDVDSRALRGVWKLTSLDEGGFPFKQRKSRVNPPSISPNPRTIWKLRGFLPMKEFTIYPKKKKTSDEEIIAESLPKKQTEIFIKLKDDHTFEQCTSLRFSDGDEADEKDSLEQKLAVELSRRERESFTWKGIWDFIDGKLILASDRPEKKPKIQQDNLAGDSGPGEVDCDDTILIGRVAVQSEESLADNPALEQRIMKQSQEEKNMPLSSQPKTGESQNKQSDQSTKITRSLDKPSPSRNRNIDVHLSVPKGTIKSGKFMYPKHHPSFFEQPIIRPRPTGSFELRQILGDYNAKLNDSPAGSDDDLVELFRKQDLVGKKFYLSTFPIPKRQKKGRERWSLKENRWVQDVYEPTEEEMKKEDLKPGKNLQVVAVELFANNTFSTLYGLGSSMVLRGKWSIIGDKRDQLWMQIFRFGFGRSVSGSTFSEGMALTQNDEKAYWGKITEVEDLSGDSVEDSPSEWGGKKIEVKGAVMVGWGLEPCSVGRFKMIEMEDDVIEDEEPDDEDAPEGNERSSSSADVLSELDDHELDGRIDPFNLPGAFE